MVLETLVIAWPNSDDPSRWERHIESITKLPTLEQLRTFLEGRIHSVEGLEHPRSGGSDDRKGTTAKSAGVRQVVQGAANVCHLRKGTQFPLYCPQSKKQTAAERKSTVKSRQLCTNCLGKHTLDKCSNTKQCQRYSDRHTVLHEAYLSEETALLQHAALPRPRAMSVILSTARVIVEGSGGAIETVRILIDPGSEVSLITESLVQRLTLLRKDGKIPLLGVGGSRFCVIRGRAILQLTSTLPQESCVRIETYTLPELS
nr:uncharacterized protein LOC117224509 [Megalopta genalis]